MILFTFGTLVDEKQMHEFNNIKKEKLMLFCLKDIKL